MARSYNRLNIPGIMCSSRCKTKYTWQYQEPTLVYSAFIIVGSCSDLVNSMSPWQGPQSTSYLHLTIILNVPNSMSSTFQVPGQQRLFGLALSKGYFLSTKSPPSMNGDPPWLGRTRFQLSKELPVGHCSGKTKIPVVSEFKVTAVHTFEHSQLDINSISLWSQSWKQECLDKPKYVNRFEKTWEKSDF